MKTVTIYTDGACSGNPGPGGWGAILQYGKAEKELSGSEPSTTNNRMELLGVITALETLKEPCSVDLYSDSKYVVDGITKAGPRAGVRAAGLKAIRNPQKIRNSGVVCSICWINTRCGSIGSRVTRIIHITTAVTSLPSVSIRSISKAVAKLQFRRQAGTDRGPFQSRPKVPIQKLSPSRSQKSQVHAPTFLHLQSKCYFTRAAARIG